MSDTIYWNGTCCEVKTTTNKQCETDFGADAEAARLYPLNNRKPIAERCEKQIYGAIRLGATSFDKTKHNPTSGMLLDASFARFARTGI